MEIINEEIMYLIDKLLKKYAYLNIDKKSVLELARKEIIALDNKRMDIKTYLKKIKSTIEARIVYMGTALFADSEKAATIVSNYVTSKYTSINTYTEAKELLKDLSKLFYMYNSIPEPNTLGKLIRENELVGKALELVVDKHLEAIKAGHITKSLDDNTIMSLIGIYCLHKGIEIEEETVPNDDERFSDDNVQMYYNEISLIPLVSYSELTSLCKRINEGDEQAKNRLIEGNLRLVVNVAKAFYRSDSSVGMLDLI